MVCPSQLTWTVTDGSHIYSKPTRLIYILCAGALDEFDSGLAEQQGGARQDHVPDVLTGASESENQPDTTIIYHASGSAQCSPAPGKGPTFNPLGRRPKKEKPPALPPPAINDLSDVSQEELESSAKELAAMLQNMMKGA